MTRKLLIVVIILTFAFIPAIGIDVADAHGFGGGFHTGGFQGRDIDRRGFFRRGFFGWGSFGEYGGFAPYYYGYPPLCYYTVYGTTACY